MATSARFHVNNDIWNWIMQTSKNLLNDKMIKEIKYWLSSSKVKSSNEKSKVKLRNPTINQIRDISKKVHLPFGYFFLNKPPKIDIPLMNYRTINNSPVINPSRELTDTIIDMNSKLKWIKRYRRRLSEEKIPFVGAYKNISDNDPEDIANSMLRYFHLDSGWNFKAKFKRFNFLRRILSNYGITVMVNGCIRNNQYRPLNVDEFRAFVLMDQYAPLIFVNSKDYYHARLFSLVHELVHIGFGTPELFNNNFKSNPKYFHVKLEQKINHVVAYILFPKRLFINTWDQISQKYENFNNIDKIKEEASCFGTSILATAIRAHYLVGFPNSDIKIIKNHFKNQSNNKDNNGGDYYNGLAYKTDPSFANDVAYSVENGNTSYSKAFDLLSINGTDQFSKLLNHLN